MSQKPLSRAHYIALIIIFLIALLACALMPVMPQPPSYMILADTQTRFGIPNFSDVFSNIVFGILGAVGLLTPGNYRTSFEKYMYKVFFAAIFLVSIGSSYYHCAPNFWSLLWDRLPITVAMMCLLTAVIAELVNLKLAKILVAPLIILGLFSASYWYYTEIHGNGDLRLYLFTQIFPALFIPILLVLTKPKNGCYLWFAIGAYLCARVSEHFDHEIFALTQQTMSGHTLKHLLMGVGVYFIYLYQRR